LALNYVNATQATGVISVGMAFGCDPTRQSLGDVLVGTQLVPYDNRDIRLVDGQVTTTYDRVRRRRAKPSLLRLMEEHTKRPGAPRAHFGALLSGAARIHCAGFRDKLRAAVPQKGEPVIGGEMVGVGLLTASDPHDPNWLVVKGISDFGDEERDAIIERTRAPACLAAARFVLGALSGRP
jgi:adenosylhomocysteine nucleosidase